MLNNLWQLQDAKNRFSNLVDKAKNYGPQIVTKHGKETVVGMLNLIGFNIFRCDFYPYH